MKDKYLDVATSFITKYHNYSDEQLEELRYGLEGLYLNVTKLLIIFILALVLGMIKELILLLIMFNIIRFTGFGFHARTSLECLVCSTLLFILLPLIIQYIHLDKIYLLGLGIICLILLAVFAPADTVKRPLPNKRKRKIRKISTIIIATVYILVSWFIDDYEISYLLITALMMEALMVSPLMYKIFKQPYRNYLNYNKA